MGSKGLRRDIGRYFGIRCLHVLSICKMTARTCAIIALSLDYHVGVKDVQSVSVEIIMYLMRLERRPRDAYGL